MPDFLITELGRAVPYGIYDLAANAGWVSVGMDQDTAAFAVQTIRRWWHEIGHVRYPGAKRLVITADGGGSNGSRVRLWKRELQGLATELGIDILIHHLPPGTSKWNKIEHRLFSFISMNWRATPLVSDRVIVDLISAPPLIRASRCAANLTPTPIPRASLSPIRRWPPSPSPVPIFTASGTTRSNQATAQIQRLIPDKP